MKSLFLHGRSSSSTTNVQSENVACTFVRSVQDYRHTKYFNSQGEDISQEYFDAFKDRREHELDIARVEKQFAITLSVDGEERRFPAAERNIDPDFLDNKAGNVPVVASIRARAKSPEDIEKGVELFKARFVKETGKEPKGEDLAQIKEKAKSPWVDCVGIVKQYESFSDKASALAQALKAAGVADKVTLALS